MVVTINNNKYLKYHYNSKLFWLKNWIKNIFSYPLIEPKDYFMFWFNIYLDNYYYNFSINQRKIYILKFLFILILKGINKIEYPILINLISYNIDSIYLGYFKKQLGSYKVFFNFKDFFLFNFMFNNLEILISKKKSFLDKFK